MNKKNFNDWVKNCQRKVEETAQRELPKPDECPEKLHEAVRYAVIGGGKRVRPLLVYAVGEMLDADAADLDLAALAIECVHSYSLIHDDMPCMDNDLLRHGKPTTHAAFGEAMAMLAGDALQPEAFCLLLKTRLPAENKVTLIALLAQASSTRGMCGGQAVDLTMVGQKMSLQALRRMHEMKTGALLRCAVLMGQACGRIQTDAALVGECLNDYGKAIGLAFQIVDDILDVEGDTASLGKTVGKDAREEKPTYVSILGLDAAKHLAREQHEKALEALAKLPPSLSGRDRLKEIADFIIARSY